MIRRQKTLLTLTAATALVLLAGCSKPPQAALDVMNTTLGEAEAAAAGEYAPDALARAQEAIAAVNTEMAAQADKFALTRSYTKTAELAAAAQQAAADATQAAAAARQKAEQDAAASLETATAALANAQSLIDTLAACRRTPKGFAADLEALRGTLDGLNGQLPAIQEAIAAQKFLSAVSLGQALTGQVTTLTTDLQGAKDRIRC